MAYDKLRPLRMQMRTAGLVAKSIPDLLPNPGSTRAMQQSVPMRGSVPNPVRMVRNPLYRVERRMYTFTRETTRWLRSLDEVEQYAKTVLVNYREAFSRVDWPLRFEQTEARGAWYQSGVITVPIPVQQMAVLHELSHHLSGMEAEHGPDFFNTYMTLIRVEIGDELADRFIAEMGTL